MSDIRGNTLRTAEGTPVHLPDDVKISDSTFHDFTSAQKEIERLRDVLLGIEMLTATGDGLSPDECMSVHLLAAEGRSNDPYAWRADPAVIDSLRAAIQVHKVERD